MARLWDKGLPLDERILEFTAGEDHVLDERLVALRRARVDRARADARGSRGCSRRRLRRDLRRARGARREHAAGEWSIELADEDAPDALERRLTERIGAAGGRVHLGRSRNDQVLVALRLYLRDAIARARGRRRRRRRGARARSQPSKARSPCPATRTCSPQCRAPSRSGRAASRRRSRDDRDGLEPCRRAHEESARLGRRLRRAESAARSRGDARGARLRSDARAGDGGAAVARQGRSAR